MTTFEFKVNYPFKDTVHQHKIDIYIYVIPNLCKLIFLVNGTQKEKICII